MARYEVRVVVLLCILPAALAAISLDAARRRAMRARFTPAIEAVVRRLPAGDLALSGGARWLRMPTLEEPGAAFEDNPAAPDPDPAGGAMAPPVGMWMREPR